MEHNATPVNKTGASGKVYHRYQAPAVEPSKFKTLAHLSMIIIAFVLGLVLAGFGRV